MFDAIIRFTLNKYWDSKTMMTVMCLVDIFDAPMMYPGYLCVLSVMRGRGYGKRRGNWDDLANNLNFIASIIFLLDNSAFDRLFDDRAPPEHWERDADAVSGFLFHVVWRNFRGLFICGTVMDIPSLMHGKCSEHWQYVVTHAVSDYIVSGESLTCWISWSFCIVLSDEWPLDGPRFHAID